MALHDPRLVILAGGISSRMKIPAAIALTDELQQQAADRTKGMLGVGTGGRPFLDYLLYHAREAGLRDIVIVIGPHDQAVRSYYGEHDRGNPFHGLFLSYAVQAIPAGRTKPLGTADALLHALLAKPEWAGGDFIVCNSDNLYSIRTFRMLIDDDAPNSLIDYDRDGLEFDEQRIAQFGITRKNHEGFLMEIVEKPPEEKLVTLREKDGTLRVSMNIFRLRYDMILPYLRSCPVHPVRLEKELVTAVTRMVQDHPRSLKVLPLKEHVPDLTYQADIPAVQQFITKNFSASLW